MKWSEIFQKQAPMRSVVLALIPGWIASVYFFGWISAFIVLLSVTTCIVTEWLFVRKSQGKISEAALVTGFLFALTLPPTIPFFMIILGAVFGITFGKMAFGGFGTNIFNPAMVSRAFVYITFPVYMTNRWIPAADFSHFPGGFAVWRFIKDPDVSAITTATPSHALKAGAHELPGYLQLFLGNINGQFESLGEMTLIGGGSLGETSAVMLMLGGLYLLFKKTAKWRLVVSFFGMYLAFQSVIYLLDSGPVPDPLYAVLSGGAVLGGFFMVTDPVSAVKTKPAQWLYGSFIAIMTVLIRTYSLFAGGLMFSILLGNMFGPLMDIASRTFQSRRSAH